MMGALQEAVLNMHLAVASLAASCCYLTVHCTAIFVIKR